MSNMPDNVVPFPIRAKRENDATLGQKAADEKSAVSDRIRAQSLHRRLDDKKMMNKESDRIRVAKNLERILNEMKAKGQSPERLLRDLGMGKGGDSTKQLYNYVLPEDATPEPRSTRVRALTKTASLYLRIAEGAAKAMKDDPNLIVLRLFENTSYQVADDVPDEKIASMDQIRELLVGIAEGAARRTDLASYLEILQSDKIGWDIDGSFGNYRSLAAGVFFRDRAARHVSYLGYAPTVFLYREIVGPDIEGEAFQIDFESDPDAATRLLREHKPPPKKHRTPVSLRMFREVWFGIGPMETDWTWKPLFEKRLSFHIWGKQSGNRSLSVSSYDSTIVHASNWYAKDPMGWLHQFTLLPRCPNGASLSVSVSPHIDNSESVSSEDVQREDLEDRWLILLDSFDRRSLSVDEDIADGQFFYEAVDLGSCIKYLDQVADPDDWDEFDGVCAAVELSSRWWHREEKEAWYQDSATEGWPMMHVAAPKGSIARAIEQNLLRDDVRHRLDKVLFDTVAERVQAARKCYQRVLQKRENRIASLLDSWKDA
jgi:hypothetical protein